MTDIICFGEPLVEFSQTQQPNAHHYVQGYGGDACNTAVAASRQGASVGILTALGADKFSQSLRQLWYEEGIDASHVATNGASHTGIYFISYANGQHFFDYLRQGSAASLIGPADLPLEYIRNARYLHVSGISQAISDSACDAVFEALKIARQAGATTSYDTNLRLKLWPLERARATIHAGVALADIAMPGLEDARQLTGLEDPEAIVDYYLDLGPTMVVLKMGAQGVLLAHDGQRTYIKPLTVEPLDATGAGDIFDGVFLAQLAQGTAVVTAARAANAAAALSTLKQGAIESAPSRAQVEMALARG